MESEAGLSEKRSQLDLPENTSCLRRWELDMADLRR